MSEMEGEVKNSPNHVFKVLALHNFVGCIIGKGSEMINSIIEETGCSLISAAKGNFPNTNYRMVYFQTDNRQSLMDALSKVVHLQQEKVQSGELRSDAENENHIKFTFTVPKPAIINVIGQGGTTIKELRERTGAYIDVARESVNYGPIGECEVNVTGEVFQIEQVLAEMLVILEGEFDAPWYSTWKDHKGFMNAKGKGGKKGGDKGGDKGYNFDGKGDDRKRQRSDMGKGYEPDAKRRNDDSGDYCFDFTISRCQRGNECRYNHPETCKDNERMDCSRGNNCRYLHPGQNADNYRNPGRGHDNYNNDNGKGDNGKGDRRNSDWNDSNDREFQRYNNYSKKGGSKGNKGNNSKGREERDRCFDFTVGRCDRGDSCRFTHGEAVAA